MIKISGKMDKSDTYKGFSCSDISFFIPTIFSESEEILELTNEISLLLNTL